MRVIVFVAIIIASAVFFGLFSILDEGFIHDTTLEFTYESVILTITIGAIGIGVQNTMGMKQQIPLSEKSKRTYLT